MLVSIIFLFFTLILNIDRPIKKSQEDFMKYVVGFIGFLFISLLTGCVGDVNLSSQDGTVEGASSSEVASSSDSPKWVNSLSNHIEEEKKINGEYIRKRRIKIERRTVNDVVVEKETPPAPTDKPTWVADLEKKVEVETLGKNSLRKAGIKKDLVTSITTTTSLPKEKVDIVFVVDSSYSMTPFLRKISQTFKGFIPTLRPLDWRIMFVTADQGDHKFFFNNAIARDGTAIPLEDDGTVVKGPRYITPQTKNHESIFMDSLRLHGFFEYMNEKGNTNKSNCELSPYCQGGNEQPLKTLKVFFSKNRALFRPDAHTVAVILSDSDEGIESKNRVKAEDVLQAFETEFKGQKKLVVHGAIMLDRVCANKYSNGIGQYGEGRLGVELGRMVDLTGGVKKSFCNKSYLSIAKAIVFDFS